MCWNDWLHVYPPPVQTLDSTKTDRETIYSLQTSTRLKGSWYMSHSKVMHAELITGNLTPNQTAALEQC